MIWYITSSNYHGVIRKFRAVARQMAHVIASADPPRLFNTSFSSKPTPLIRDSSFRNWSQIVAQDTVGLGFLFAESFIPNPYHLRKYVAGETENLVLDSKHTMFNAIEGDN